MRHWLVWVLLLLSVSAFGQQFSVTARLNIRSWERATLTLYDGSRQAGVFYGYLSNGQCTIRGTLPSTKPYYAILSHPSLHTPVTLFLDGGEITIDNGLVRGSKANSIYRMLLETPDSLESYVANNPSSFYAPTILYLHLPDLSYNEQQALFNRFSGDALRSYHYHLMKERLSTIAASTVGAKVRGLDSLLDGQTPVLLRFGATWCKQCKQANSHLDSLPIRQADILVDRLPGQWNHPLLKQLNIEYIPNYILLSPEGTILRRDLRWWEVMVRE
ncbi:MAG: thioredoxin family protein [Bacteroidales bacterium]|nr:thioredoxin family protein [Bacteroidales bacterium]